MIKKIVLTLVVTCVVITTLKKVIAMKFSEYEDIDIQSIRNKQ